MEKLIATTLIATSLLSIASKANAKPSRECNNLFKETLEFVNLGKDKPSMRKVLLVYRDNTTIQNGLLACARQDPAYEEMLKNLFIILRNRTNEILEQDY